MVTGANLTIIDPHSDPHRDPHERVMPVVKSVGKMGLLTNWFDVEAHTIAQALVGAGIGAAFAFLLLA